MTIVNHCEKWSPSDVIAAFNPMKNNQIKIFLRSNNQARNVLWISFNEEMNDWSIFFAAPFSIWAIRSWFDRSVIPFNQIKSN